MTYIEVCFLFPKRVGFSLFLLLTSNLTALWSKNMANERNSWTSVDLFHDKRHGFINGLNVFLFICWEQCLINGHYTSLLILLLKSFLSKKKKKPFLIFKNYFTYQLLKGIKISYMIFFSPCSFVKFCLIYFAWIKCYCL